MRVRKYFTPAEGMSIPDPAAGYAIVPPHGKWVHVSPYWLRRVGEGAGTLADAAPAAVPPPDPPTVS